MILPRRTLGATGLLVIALLAYLGRDPLRPGLLFLAGRSPHCPLQQAVRTTANERALTDAKDRLLAGSHLVKNDAAGFELWETPQGQFWIPAGNERFLAFNLAEQERDIYALPGVAVRPGDIVLDCGAGVGVFARRALAAGAEQVIAIEPAPDHIECLGRNLEKEIEAGRVILYPKGVWDAEENLPLYADPDNPASASFVRRQPGWREVGHLPLTTIDHLVRDLKFRRVDFIKMDIEGAEPRALRGGQRTLARYRPRLAISAYHMPDHATTIPRTAFAAQPSYRMRCGRCAEVAGWIRPDVLFFY